MAKFGKRSRQPDFPLGTFIMVLVLNALLHGRIIAPPCRGFGELLG